MTHALKTWPQFYKDVDAGNKPFEVRKFDRPFKVGDTILLQEYDPESKTYTGRESAFTITYLMTDTMFLKKGYCIMTIKEKE